MRFSWQVYWGGLQFPPPVDCVFSDLSTMSHPSWAALHSVADSFIELREPLHHDKAVIVKGIGYTPTSSVLVMSDSLRPHVLQHTRPPCPSPTPEVFPNSCPLSRWCHPAISSSVVPFSSHLQSFPASGSFPLNQFFASDGQSIEVSASTWVLPMNIQDWFPLGWTGWISLQSKGFSIQNKKLKALF